MPFRSPAVTCRRKRCVTALVLLVLAILFLGADGAGAADFVDSAGRRVTLPEVIGRIMPASPTAEVLVYVLAPDKLAAASREARRGAAAGRRVAVLSWRPGMGPASMAATARRLQTDLIIDAGLVTPERAAFADQVQQMSGIPYILVDDSFARMPSMLRGIGAILGVAERARHLGRYAEDTINTLRGHLLIQGPATRPHIYYGRRSDGLETALPGSPEGEAIDQAGAINVAGALGRGGLTAIAPRQLYDWNPEIVIAQRRSFYDALRRGRAWRDLAAVRHKRVYLAPAYPFGWIDDPPGVNRLIGLHWLSVLFYPDENQEDLRATTCEFYDLFYGIKLTNGQIEAMVRAAGVPPPEAPRGAGEPLPGLGPMPSTPTMPPTSTAPLPSTTAPLPTAPITPAPSTDTTPPSTSSTSPLSPVTPSAPVPPIPPTPSAAASTCTLPGANSPLTTPSPATAAPSPGPPGRRGTAPGLGIPGPLPQ